MERLIVALRTDFGCFAIIVVFVVIMISAIVFANILDSSGEQSTPVGGELPGRLGRDGVRCPSPYTVARN